MMALTFLIHVWIQLRCSAQQQQPGMMESAKQEMGHMMDRGKEMLGMGHQTTGQVSTRPFGRQCGSAHGLLLTLPT